MKPVILVATLALLIVAAQAALAQNAPDIPEPQSSAETLVEKMLQAERHLVLSGEEVTTLFRPERTFSASQTIEEVGDRDMRLQYEAPAAVNGNIYVDNGRIAWFYIPNAHRLEVGVSTLEKRRDESNEIRRQLLHHEISAALIGSDVVAGQTVQVVQVNAIGPWGQHRYWIDPANGAQLKIQTFGALGQVVSETYFTKVTYGAQIDPADFGPPKVDPDVETIPIVPRGSQSINGVPTSVQCGFVPLTPSYLPPGFTFQSSTIMPLNNEKMLGLTYQNALVTLSIFEFPLNVRAGRPESPDGFESPRQGVMVARFNGYRYIVIGNLPQEVMQQVIQSMH